MLQALDPFPRCSADAYEAIKRLELSWEKFALEHMNRMKIVMEMPAAIKFRSYHKFVQLIIAGAWQGVDGCADMLVQYYPPDWALKPASHQEAQLCAVLRQRPWEDYEWDIHEAQFPGANDYVGSLTWCCLQPFEASQLINDVHFIYADLCALAHMYVYEVLSSGCCVHMQQLCCASAHRVTTCRYSCSIVLYGCHLVLYIFECFLCDCVVNMF